MMSTACEDRRGGFGGGEGNMVSSSRVKNPQGPANSERSVPSCIADRYPATRAKAPSDESTPVETYSHAVPRIAWHLEEAGLGNGAPPASIT